MADDVWSDVERESSLGICGDLVFDIEKLAFYSLDGRAYPIIDCLKDYLRTRCFLAERLLPLRVKGIEDRLTGGRPQQHISSNSAT